MQYPKLYSPAEPIPPAKKSYLGQTIGDTAAALLAGLFVAPIATSIDKAIAQNASGQAKLVPSLLDSIRTILRHPIQFIRAPSFRYIYMVYSSTYLTANYVTTMCARKDVDPAFPKWISTSIVNTSASIFKDKRFAQLFGTGQAKPLPIQSYLAWGVRDVVSMLVFFSLPPILAKHIEAFTGNERLGRYSAQFILPLGFQFISTPIHLLGFNFYNHEKSTPAERWKAVRQDYLKNVSLRMIRILPPYSFGVLINSGVRETLGQRFSDIL